MTSTVALDLGARKSAGSLSPIDFATITEMVHRRSGIVLGADKAYLVEARLQPMLNRRGLASLGELSARLRQRADEDLACDVIDAMTTNETLFFRDARTFEHLRTHMLPMLQASWRGRPLRIWSAASSSGQEPYSIALA